MALALSMGLSLTNGVLAAEFEDVDNSDGSSFETVETTSRNLSKVKAVNLLDSQNEASPLEGMNENPKNYLNEKYPEQDWNEVTELKITPYNTEYEKNENLGNLAAAITELSGLENLPKLEHLTCSNLTSLEAIPALASLKTLTLNSCGSSTTQFSLDLSGFKNLTTLEVYSNKGLARIYNGTDSTATNIVLTGLSIVDQPKLQIELAQFPKLKSLSFIDCGLQELDLSANQELTYLDCRSNSDIAELDLEPLKLLVTLNCSYTNVKSLNLSNNPELIYLFCNNTQLGSLPDSSLDLSNNKKLEDLDCSYTDVTSLDLSNNSKLSKLSCEDTPLISLGL